MAEFVTVEVHGLKELSAALRQLPQKLERRVLNGGLMTGGRVIEKDAKTRVKVRTGATRRNIRARPGKPVDGHTATVIVGVRQLGRKQIAKLKAKGGRAALLAQDPYWWRYQEFGTSKMPASPFLRPAFEAKKVQAAFTIKEALKARIEKEAAKLRKWAR